MAPRPTPHSLKNQRRETVFLSPRSKVPGPKQLIGIKSSIHLVLTHGLRRWKSFFGFSNLWTTGFEPSVAGWAEFPDRPCSGEPAFPRTDVVRVPRPSFS